MHTMMPERLPAIFLTIVVTACSSEPPPSAPRRDASANTAIDYAGTVQLSSTDPAAQLPADYTFGPADSGTYSFTVTFWTAGTQTVAATDVATLRLPARQAV